MVGVLNTASVIWVSGHGQLKICHSLVPRRGTLLCSRNAIKVYMSCAIVQLVPTKGGH